MTSPRTEPLENCWIILSRLIGGNGRGTDPGGTRGGRGRRPGRPQWWPSAITALRAFFSLVVGATRGTLPRRNFGELRVGAVAAPAGGSAASCWRSARSPAASCPPRRRPGRCDRDAGPAGRCPRRARVSVRSWLRRGRWAWYPPFLGTTSWSCPSPGRGIRRLSWQMTCPSARARPASAASPRRAGSGPVRGNSRTRTPRRSLVRRLRTAHHSAVVT